MLERATACLKAGAAREPLQCALRAPRSKRMLHSTFWNHGAGSLDLPAWAVSMSSMPSDTLLKHGDNTQVRKAKSRKGGAQYEQLGWNTAPEGVFLDFLYPAQALAWLQRVNGHQWQRWEQRNARRLPEGFVVASRGYASRSQRQDRFGKLDVAEQNSMETASQVREDGAAFEYSAGFMDSSRIQFDDEDPHRSQETQNQGASNPDCQMDEDTRLEDNQNTVVFNPNWQRNEDPTESDLRQADGQTVRPLDSEFASSPADLAERLSSEDAPGQPLDLPYNADALQRLRHVMSSTFAAAKSSEELTQMAIGLYNSLDENNGNNARLKGEFVEFLSKQPNAMAEAKCVELYESIPTGERTFATFQAVLSLFLKQEQHEKALKLHNEALHTVENGYQISWNLFRYAVDNRQWKLAINTEADHHTRYDEGHQSSQIRVFWLHISEIPQLFAKALPLPKYLNIENEKHPRTDQFCAAFFKEAISQEFFRQDGAKSLKDLNQPEGLPTKQIRKVFEYVARSEGGAPRIFEDTLFAILAPESRFEYHQVHALVSSLYYTYIKMDGARPAERLLELWLERLTIYGEGLRELKRGPNSSSIKFVLNEWKRLYDRVNIRGVKILLRFYARVGLVESFGEWLAYLRANYPDYQDQKDILWMTIHLHARRADLDGAQQAFAEVQRICAENNDEPQKICWNTLLHAHSRADDLEGALTNLQNMMDHAKLTPDQYSFQSVLQMLSRRGDVEGVEDLLSQYDQITQIPRVTSQVGSLLVAHINNEDLQSAESILQDAIPHVRAGKIHGSLTHCFNLLMNAHATNRDIDATMRTYRWMRDENIRRDANSYAALMQALVIFRRTDEAYVILKQVMSDNDVEPTAYHYAIVINGFINGQLYQKALDAHARMERLNIRPTISTHRAYLKAKAILERRRIKRHSARDSPPVPLEETMEELEHLLRPNDSAEIASQQPQFFVGSSTGDLQLPEASPAAYFDFLIFVHGQRRCFEAVRELFRRYKQHAYERGQGLDATPIRLLGSLMAAYWRAGEHVKVEECWSLAKTNANEIAPRVPVPLLKAQAGGDAPRSDALNLQPPSPEPHIAEKTITRDERDSSMEPKQTLLLPDQNRRLQRPAPGRRYILSRVLRYYVLSLHDQGRTADAINTITEALSQGYNLDNRTWNMFIESLCRTSPPLCLLAYVLTERFLIPHFPGWSGGTKYRPKLSDVAEGLQYIKARYLPRTQLMPQYRTLVWLNKALLDTRRLEALGRKPSSNVLSAELQRYVGTVRQVRLQAPRTLFAVQSMPSVADKTQTQVLRREGA